MRGTQLTSTHSSQPRTLARAIASALVVPLLLAAPAAAAPPSSSESVLDIGLNRQKVLQVQGVIQRIAVGNPEVADVKAIGSPPNEVVILGVAEGRTTLLIWRSGGEPRLSYVINVRETPLEDLLKEIQNLLGDMEGVSPKIVGDRIIVEGETLTPEDSERVKRVAGLYKEQKVVNLVKDGMGSVRSQARNLARAFNEQGLKTIQTNVVGSSIFLEGTVESPEDLKKAEFIVKAMNARVESLVTVGIKRMVLVEVQIVEIRRNDDLGIGITYPTNLRTTDGAGVLFTHTYIDPPMPGQPGSQSNLTTNVELQSDFAIRMRFDNGYGRLLSQPKLVCASGEKAEFQVGGEVPIVIVTQNMINVEFKPFGVLLNLTPNADRQGNIQTTIEAEVSDVDRSLTIRLGGTEIPGFRTRKVKTNVTVKHGETIVLSGLFNYDQQKNVSKVPLLGHIPILGELFKSRNFVERKNEIAVFVTPKIVNPDSDRIRETIDKIKERYKDAADAVGFNIWD